MLQVLFCIAAADSFANLHHRRFIAILATEPVLEQNRQCHPQAMASDNERARRFFMQALGASTAVMHSGQLVSILPSIAR